MKAAELVKTISVPPIFATGNRLWIWNCSIGSTAMIAIRSDFLSRTTPAARITLSTPAAKPSSKNTMSPQGEMPSQRSSSQPITAPTSTPATSSVESRKPRANAEASAVERGPEPFSDGRFAVASRSPSRWSLAERAASSSGGSLPSPLPRVPSAMLSTRVDFRFRVSRRPKSRADHTYRVSASQGTAPAA